MKRAFAAGLCILFLVIATIQADDECVCNEPTDCCFRGECFEPGWEDARRFSCDGVQGDANCDGDPDCCVWDSVESKPKWGDCCPGCLSECCPSGDDCAFDYECYGSVCKEEDNGDTPAGCIGNWRACYNGRCCGSLNTEYDQYEIYMYRKSHNAITGGCSFGKWFDECFKGGTQESDDQCCDGGGVYWCVYNGNCYAGYGYYDLGSGVDSNNIYCSQQSWVDPDSYRSWCEDASQTWTVAGETTAGEYEDLVTEECCGDDDGEYYAPLCAGVSGVSRRCCSSVNDCINGNGDCVRTECDVSSALCPTAECRSGTWYSGFYESGQPNCCGNDYPGENYRTRLLMYGDDDDIDFSAYSSDRACCSSNTDCIAGGACFMPGPRDIRSYIAGEDDLKSWCGGSWVDCDYSPAFCSGCGETWLNGGNDGAGEYSGSEQECCGDDLSENERSREIYTVGAEDYDIDFGANSGDDACCAAGSSCVANDICYVTNAATDLRSDVGGEDDLRSYCAGGRWADCDAASGMCQGCGYEWAECGETSVIGEYDTTTSSECCGDDSGEVFNSRIASPAPDNDDIDFGNSDAEGACCDSSKCAAGNNCYASGAAYDLSFMSDEDDYKSYCAGSAWFDCDFSSGICGTFCGYQDGGGQAKWTQRGEAGVGEFSDDAEEGCCGDDAGENYGCNPLIEYATTCACCNNANDHVDQCGDCQSCGIEGSSCSSDGDCCLLDACTGDPLYCSGVDDQGQPIADSRCCPEKEWWDGERCRERTPCGLDVHVNEFQYCPYRPPNDPGGPQSEYFPDVPWCIIIATREACCYFSELYGEEDVYYMTDYQVNP